MSGATEKRLKKDVYKLVMQITADLKGEPVNMVDPKTPLSALISEAEIDYILQQIVQDDEVDLAVWGRAEELSRDKRVLMDNDITIGAFASMLAGSESIMTSYTSSTPPPQTDAAIQKV